MKVLGSHGRYPKILYLQSVPVFKAHHLSSGQLTLVVCCRWRIIHGVYNKPLQGSLWNSQYNGMSSKSLHFEVVFGAHPGGVSLGFLRGFNVETVEYRNLRLTVWDIGGAYWKPFLSGRSWTVRFLKCDCYCYCVNLGLVSRVFEQKIPQLLRFDFPFQYGFPKAKPMFGGSSWSCKNS